MGFCRRCGEIVTTARCKCGGTPRDSTTNILFPKKSSDKWSQSYLTRSSPTSSPNHSTSASPTSPSKTSSFLDQQTAYLPSSSAPPQDSDHELNSVFGSVLSPTDCWQCVACSRPFKPEETLYPHPDAKADLNLSETYFCRKCFAKRFSKGNCGKCRLAVLSDAPFIKHHYEVWHKTCFFCSYCDSQDEPFIDMAGKPSCEPCFDSQAHISRNIPPSPHLAQSPVMGLSSPKLPPAPARWGSGSHLKPKPLYSSEIEEPSYFQDHKPPRAWKEREKSPLRPSYNELKSKLKEAGLESTAPPVVAKDRRRASSTTAITQSLASNRPHSYSSASSRARSQSPSKLPSHNDTLSRPSPAPSTTIQTPTYPRTSSTQPGYTSSSSPLSPSALWVARKAALSSPGPSSPLFPGSSLSRPPLSRSPEKSFFAEKSFFSRPLSPAKAGTAAEKTPLQRRVPSSRPASWAVAPSPTSPVAPQNKNTTSRPISWSFTPATPSPATPNTPSAPALNEDQCAGCHLDLGYGELISLPNAGGALYHRRCLTCKGCSKPLDAGKHTLIEGNLFHKQCAPPPNRYRTIITSLADPVPEDDSEALPSTPLLADIEPPCASCQLPLGPGMSITLPRSLKSFHQTCLTCKGCQRGFATKAGERSFIEVGDELYHPQCSPRAPPSPTRSEPFRLSTSRSTPPATNRVSTSPFKSPPPPLSPFKSPSIFATRTRPPAGLGGLLICAGCSVRTTEKETVAGPRGMRYHKRCLKCGCGRELDSEARVGERGQLSCEGCRAMDARRKRESVMVVR